MFLSVLAMFACRVVDASKRSGSLRLPRGRNGMSPREARHIAFLCILIIIRGQVKHEMELLFNPNHYPIFKKLVSE